VRFAVEARPSVTGKVIPNEFVGEKEEKKAISGSATPRESERGQPEFWGP